MEFNLLKRYPRAKRSSTNRLISEEMKNKVRKLEANYWDGTREEGFGGYFYDGRWQKIAEDATVRYSLNEKSRVLIDRCGAEKGFLVYDLKKLVPGITVYGMHCATYPIVKAMDGYGRYLIRSGYGRDAEAAELDAKNSVIPYLINADPRDVPFKDKFFDTVISINSACAYPEEECRKVVREIKRVTKDGGRRSYIQNDSWGNEKEKENLLKWTFLCQTFLDKNGWKRLFEEEGYAGDWGFTIIESE